MKNRTMRVAALLLVLTLMTSCFVGGTFAKYTVGTNITADTARVAKWGVTVTGTGVAFSDSYLNTATSYTANESDATITVQSATAGDKVIAPGTNGTLAAFDISGTPEVDTQVTYTATLTLTGWVVNGAEYCPIVFTVNSTEYKIGGTDLEGNDIVDVEDLQKAVAAAIEAANATYHTNQDLSNAEDDLIVKWAWAYEGNDDAKDTELGNLSTAPTISLKVDCTITQVN